MFATPSSRYVIGTLPWYSVLIVTGICLALLLALREEKRLGLPKDTVIDLALWLIPAGIVGARLYYVLFTWDMFRADPLRILRIWEGGLAIYGAVLGGLLAALLFSRKRGIPLFTLTDMIVPGLVLAQAIGRWGNYFNMEAYGDAVTDPRWQFFPASVLIPGPSGGVWHQATFFYESAWNLLVFLVLMLSRRHTRRSGDTTLWYVALYGAGRFVIEGLRTDSLMLGGLRVSQGLSGAMVLGVLIVFLLRAWKDGRRLPVLLLLAAAAVAAPLILIMSLPATIGHLLLMLLALLICTLAYIQTKPCVLEDQPCPPPPSKI